MRAIKSGWNWLNSPKCHFRELTAKNKINLANNWPIFSWVITVISMKYIKVISGPLKKLNKSIWKFFVRFLVQALMFSCINLTRVSLCTLPWLLTLHWPHITQRQRGVMLGTFGWCKLMLNIAKSILQLEKKYRKFIVYSLAPGTFQ